MANPRHLANIRKGVIAWNEWRFKTAFHANLAKADLRGLRLQGADFRGADLRGANLQGVNLRAATFMRADLSGANLSGAFLSRANFRMANLSGADLRGAKLGRADLSETDLSRANLSGANLRRADLVEAKLDRADLTGCSVYGISAWNMSLKGTILRNLVVTPPEESTIQVDNLEVAQFVYLLLKNQNIRGVIETIGSKGVLILGRFTERKRVLDAVRSKLRRLGYLPIVFDFKRPTDRDFTETVMTLAGMSRFIIADITKPRSVPLELEATVPNYMIPFVPIIEDGERPFAMFKDLWKKYREWVLAPLAYDTVDHLISVLEEAVIGPANEKLQVLRARKAEELVMRHVKNYQKPDRKNSFYRRI